ncbi:signal transduction histidine kinase [Mucilaginibacter sp. UYP25]|uniref:tetratricopeptide repeat-containing sensor histidine kinase n=1 Tax=unclassified Mucilaginibacter TaxID=2617802 RepID=UPI00339B17DC
MKKLLFLLLYLICLLSCKKHAEPLATTETADFKKGEALFNQQKTDSAFYYFDKAATSTKDSLQIAMSYNYMGSIQANEGDYFGAHESLVTSLRYLDENKPIHRYCLASDYNELGMTNSNLKNFDDAIHYFDLALKFSDSKDYSLIFTNNKANAYRNKKVYAKALTLYKRVLRGFKVDDKEYARTLTNIAITKWLNNHAYAAAPDLLKALAIRMQAKDLWGQNSSYAHLSDYYSSTRPDSAFYYALKMHGISRQLESPDDELEALEKLIKLSPPTKTREYFRQFEKLNDSLQTARNAAKNQFALIRYNVEKAKSENLKLQKDNANKKLQLIQQNIRLYGILLAFIIIATIAVLWYRKRQQRQALDKQNAIVETNQKASKKVHDTLANDIYRIMKRVQQEPILDRSWLEDNIDEVYQRARDLSYEIITDPDEFYAEKIDDLLMGFETDDVKIILIGNEKEFWQKFPVTVKSELKYVLQEFMVNMQKHSKACNVVVKFRVTPEHYLINYNDDGVGFPPNYSPNNGLQNTENRIKAINSEITFASIPGSGLEIQIKIPIA